MNTAIISEALRAGHCCLRIVTTEESEARQAIFDAAIQRKLDLWSWSATTGLVLGPLAHSQPVPDTMNAAAALVQLRQQLLNPSLILMHDLADHFTDPRVVRALRELTEHLRMGIPPDSCLVMLDHCDAVPPVVEGLSYKITPPLPTDEQIDGLIRRTLQNIHVSTPIKITLTKRDFTAITQNLRGLTKRQIEDLVRTAILTDHAFTPEDLPAIIHAKRERIRSAGVLDFIDSPASIDEIGGLSRLKTWLARREKSFSDEARAFGLVPPRGVLLLGVQGAGKSLAAKAIATAWRRPLMRLDPGALFDRYIGESEKRLRDALAQAEAMAPAVLWIDEIEKGFASAASRSTDGGLSQRMFGTLLTWMQEHKSPVFLVATANDIEALPPELLRKGRFDEIFFVDLPNADGRRAIFEIHLRRRKIDPAKMDLALLVGVSEGYSGSEIEQAVLAALHESFATRTPVDTSTLQRAIVESPPLSVTMRERIAELRKWASARCVPAD